MHLIFECVNIGLSAMISVDKNMFLLFCIGKKDEKPGPGELKVLV